MPRYKDIRSLEMFPAATTQERKKPTWICSHFPPPVHFSAFICLKNLKVTKRLNRCGAAQMNMWPTDCSERQKSSEGSLLSFDWETVLIFHSVEARQRRGASTNHLHVHQINLTLSLSPSPSTGLSFGRELLTSPPSLRWEKRGDFLSFLSPSVSFITPVVISWSRDFFPFVGSVKGG